MEKHNKAHQAANLSLEKGAAKYPYKFVLATTSGVGKYKEQGYKYLLDSYLFELLPTGERQSSSGTWFTLNCI